MYLYKVEVKKSEIEGKGVFALESIKKDSIVWKFDKDNELMMSQGEFDKLGPEKKKEIEKIGYFSSISRKWIVPPEKDPAYFTNNDSLKNNLSVVYDKKISPEPFFVANRDIVKGEELINNYLEFDEFTKENKPCWI